MFRSSVQQPILGGWRTLLHERLIRDAFVLRTVSCRFVAFLFYVCSYRQYTRVALTYNLRVTKEAVAIKVVLWTGYLVLLLLQIHGVIPESKLNRDPETRVYLYYSIVS